MDYKRRKIFSTTKYLFIICLITGFLPGCSEREENRQNTYYIELINFSDSLGNYISANAFGKVAFYKNNELKIMSQNFITEKYPDMHYIAGIDALDTKKIEPETKKIRVEFVGNYSVDSIKYALSKYSYSDNKWKKISDMGTLKGVTTYKRAKEFSKTEFGKQIINSMIAYTYQ